MIKFCDIKNPTNIVEGVIQDEPLEWQKVGAGYILRTRMEHDREYIEKCKEQILQNQEIVERLKEYIKRITDMDQNFPFGRITCAKELQSILKGEKE